MSSSSPADAELSTRIRQQEVVKELGQQALREDDLDGLLHDAAAAVAETLDTEYSEVLELLPGGEEVFLRQGVGWRDGIVGEATVPTDRDSQAGYTLLSAEPIIVEDLRTEARFSGPELLTSHDVVSGISVVVGSVEDPWGVLGTHSTERREFTEHDANFVKSVANVLAAAVENERTRSELEEIYGRISDAFFALDREWRFTHVNEHAHELINPEGRTLIGERFWKEFPEAVGRKFEAEYERAMREQETVTFEEYYPDPLDAWFEVRAYPSETGLSVYFRDVTDRKERERERRRHETIVETVNDGVYVVDEDQRFTMVNDAYAEMVGYDGDELLGEHVSLVVDEDVTERARRTEEAMRDGRGDGHGVEAELRTASGDSLPTEATFSLLPNADGDGHRVGIVRDVSDRQARERELRRKERRFEAVFEDPNILVGLLDPDGTVLDVNGTAMEYVDADLEEVIGQPFWETPWWGDDGDAADVREWVRRAAAGEYVDFEADLTRPDGQAYALSGYFRPVTNDDGEVVSLIVSDRDVTDRREYERALEERERQLSTLMENVPGMVYRCRNERGWPMEFVSDASTALTGYDPAAIERGDVRWGADVMVQTDRQQVWETIQRDVNETGTFSVTYRIETADGDVRWVRDDGRGVFDDEGTFVGIEGIIADVTERKRLETELRESERRYRTLVEHFPNGAVALVDEDLRYRTVGGSPLDVADATTEELEGKSVSEAVPQNLADELVPRYEAALDGESDAFQKELDGGTFQFQFVPVRDDDGEVFAALGMSQDVTERIEAQRNLEESERRYRTLVEHFPNGAVGMFDRDLRYTAVGGRLLDEVGVSPDERVGNRVSDVYPDGLVEEVEPYFRAALAGETNRFEVAFHGRHLLAHALPVRNADDEVFAGMLVVQDVTDRKKMERELRESEAKFRMLAENLEEVVWMSTPDGEEILYVNPAFEEVWGRDREALYDAPESFMDAIHPDDREEVVATYETLPDERYDEEFRIVRPDGEVRWIHAQATRVHNGDGAVSRIVGIAEDVTERKERERALEESERRYRTLAEHFPNGAVGVYDDDLRFTLAEGAVLGDTLPPADVIEGSDVHKLIPEEAIADLEPLFRAAVEDGETGNTTTEFDGRHWRVWATPLRDADGEVFAALSFAQDVTDQAERQRRLEGLIDQLGESNERLEQFAYAASHDLQEPLRMVSSYLQLVEGRYADELDEDGQEFIEFAVDGADRMRGMIDGLLEYSRVETKGDPFEPVDLDEVLADVLADLGMRIDESDASVTSDPLARVSGDRDQLRQVFQNLLGNAIEYSGDDPPRIRVTAERAGDRWVVSVSDEGIGIDPADAERVFEVFHRAHDRDQRTGTGIGLALCERIVERHGGEIWVDSVPGEGATLSFTLPVAGDDDE